MGLKHYEPYFGNRTFIVIFAIYLKVSHYLFKTPIVSQVIIKLSNLKALSNGCDIKLYLIPLTPLNHISELMLAEVVITGGLQYFQATFIFKISEKS